MKVVDLHSYQDCSESCLKSLQLQVLPDWNDQFHQLSAVVCLLSSHVLCDIKRQRDFDFQHLSEPPIARTVSQSTSDIHLVPSCVLLGCRMKFCPLNISQPVRQQGQPPCHPGCTRVWCQGGLPWVCWHWSSFAGLNFCPMPRRFNHCCS